jgi:hypothetical protein
MIVAKAAHDFIMEDRSAGEVVGEFVAGLAPLYDSSDLSEDIMEALRRYLVFLGSRRVSNLSLLLESFVWYRANFETTATRRKKLPLFVEAGGGRLMPSPSYAAVKDFSRVLHADSAFKAYAQALKSGHVPLRPRDWLPASETAFMPLMSVLFRVTEEVVPVRMVG